MEFNPAKCEAVTFTRKSGPVKTKYNLHGTTLETVVLVVVVVVVVVVVANCSQPV